MNLNRTGTLWDRNERIKINDNWDKIENIIYSNGEPLFDSESFESWLVENSFTPKSAVKKVTDLPNDAEKNEVRGVEETNKIYVYDGIEWIAFASLSFDALNQLNSELYDTLGIVNDMKNTLDTKTKEVEQINDDFDSIVKNTNYWQKHKLTKDDGEVETFLDFDFNTEVESLSGSKSFYVSKSHNGPAGVSRNGFTTVDKRIDNATNSDQYSVIFIPYNSEKIYMRLKTPSGWRDWKEITGSIEDTGWVEVDFEVGYTNTAYGGTQNGFKTAYRIVRQGDNIQKMVRINGSNINNGDSFLKLPTGFVRHAQVFYIRTPLKFLANIVFDPSGNVRFYLQNSNKDDWVAKEAYYIYGEFVWNEYSKKNG